MMCTVLHHGVPVGALRLPEGELVSARLDPLPAYASIADVVRAGSGVLLAQGFFGAATAPAQPDPARERAVAAAAALAFELEDVEGRPVAADFVNLIEAPDGGVVAIARLRGAHAHVPAVERRAPRAEREQRAEPDV